MFQVYFEFIKNLVMKYIQVYFEPVFEMHLYFFSGSVVYLKYTLHFFQTQKYT